MSFAKRISVFLPFFLLIALCAVKVYGQEVIVSTDKIKYSQGEKIKITLTNKLEKSIFSVAASSTPTFAIENLEKNLKSEVWGSLAVRCEWPECDVDHDGPAEIKAGQEVSFFWGPHIYVNRVYFPVQAGLYRLSLTYQIRKDDNPKNWKWITEKSNEFTIEK